ncbi:hypothetical protein BDN72DRAFT_966321 [Pluteus cervinus]|uniref:Uncharacterized protein n=1 Tax=Pluteus cervinus TaxID=181527 RepID=A0ACD2ZZJ2_9AGAR|nr:hypothetical protein BDN72DRAFT_966321 [Pluteus cervinus]
MSTGNQHQEELRQKIDAEILQLRLRIAALSAARNTLAPIACLPADILASIFHEARRNTNYLLRGDTLQSLKASWVCRDWRHVALDHATLWTDISVPSLLKGVPELLSRSKQALLSVSLDKIPSQDISPLIPLVLRQLPRIRLLELRRARSLDDGTDDIIRLGPLWDLPAPALVALRLRGVELPENVFNALPLPSLQQLVLENCVTPWSLAIFSNLRTFSISRPHLKLPPATLLEILQQTPNLIELKLESALDEPAMVIGDESSPRIPLSCLRTLQVLEEDPNTITQILRHTSLSRISRLDASLQYWTPGGHPAEIIEELYRLFGKSRPIHTFHLFKDNSSCSLEAFTTSATNATIKFIELRLEHDGRPEPDIYSLSSDLLDFRLLGALDMRGDCEIISPDIWRTMFGSLPHLRTVVAYESMAESFCRVLDEEGRTLKSGCPYILPPAVPSSNEPEARAKYLEACAQVKEFLSTTNILFPALRELMLIYSMRFNDLDTGEGQGFPFNMTIRRFGGIGLTRFQYSDLPGSFPDPTPLQEGGIIDEVHLISDYDL